MKKLVILSIVATMSMSTFAFANSPAKPDDTVEAVNPIYKLTEDAEVPMIAVDRDTLEEITLATEAGEANGYDVVWNGVEKSVTFANDVNTLKATAGSNVYVVNGDFVELETPMSIINDRSYVPASFVQLLEIEPATPVAPIAEIPDELTSSSAIETIDSTVDPLVSMEVANKIATVVDDKVAEYTQEQEQANAEYKEAYLATGGTEADYVEPEYKIDAEILSQDDKYISVKVYRYTSLASSYTDETYYTFDATTGDTVDLEYFLGSDYQALVKDSIIKTCEEADDIEYDQEALDNLVIDETTDFYLDEGNNLIVVLPKYSIAAGSEGVQEFPIKVAKIMN